jgi:uncharacterized protein (TIGR00251 family)
MLVNIKVITRAKENHICASRSCVITESKFRNNKIKEEKDGLKIYLTAVPEKGKANQLLIKLLADYYKVSKNKIKIIKGEKSKNKVIEIIKK